MFAHGYQTLTDGAEVVYQVSEAYTPGTERGLRHDDPALGLRWPLPVSVLSRQGRRLAAAGTPVILVDRALEQRQREGRPVRVAMVGAGFMGRGVAAQIIRSTPGMELVAVSNRHLAGAERAYREAGVDELRVVDDAAGPRPRDRRRRAGRHRGRRGTVRRRRGRRRLRRHGCRGVRGRRDAGRLRARQARRHDERRARRHGRAAAQGPRGRGGCRLQRRRRRPAGGAAEPAPLRPGHRPDPAGLRQHQGPAGRVPEPDHAGGLRPRRGARTRTWSPASPTARRCPSSRPSSPTRPG